MRRAQATMLWLMAVGVLVLVFASSSEFAVLEPATFVDCRIKGPRVEVILGASPPTGFIAVVTPTREVLRLVDAGKSLDLLGQRYRTQPLILSIPDELGATQDGRQKRIFATPGEYAIVFREVKEMASDELGSECKVRINAK